MWKRRDSRVTGCGCTSSRSVTPFNSMLPTSWRRLLSLIRIVLGMSCLTIQLISSSFAVTDTVILFAGYTMYACVTLFWRSLEDSGYPTLALIVDFVFFFLSATSSAPYSYWVSSVFLCLRDDRGGDAAQLVEGSRHRDWGGGAAIPCSNAARRSSAAWSDFRGHSGMRAGHPA